MNGEVVENEKPKKVVSCELLVASEKPASNQQLATSNQQLPARRRGSVLLMVVVILLILAIMGTTYLATTRVDRMTSLQDVANSQIDQISDGVRDLATSYIVNGLLVLNPVTGTYVYRPGSTSGYNNFDAPVYPQVGVGVSAGVGLGDPWLADRVPVIPSALPNPITPPAPIGGSPAISAGSPAWMAITAPLNAAGPNSFAAFEDPSTGIQYNPTQVAPVWNPNQTYAAMAIVSYQGRYYQAAAPTIGTPPALGGWTVYSNPAFLMHLPVYPTFEQITATSPFYPALEDQSGHAYIAGDADGDGIADCGLFRLPGIYNDGLTYYAGVRIIDNNSAVNVNTAWDDQSDYNISTGVAYPAGTSPQPALFPWCFPSGVGLKQMLHGTDSVINNLPNSPYLNAVRLAGIRPSISGWPDNGGPADTTFSFATQGDAMNHQLSRRLANAGYIASGVRSRAFGDADAAALAYHFGLINPSAFNLSSYNSTTGQYSGSTLVETLLPVTTFQSAPNYANNANHLAPPYGNAPWRAYPPIPTGATNSPGQWYADNFNTFPPTNLRPFLVTRNGVSNAAPANTPNPLNPAVQTVASAQMLPYGDRGRWQPNVYYSAGDIVTYSAALPPTAVYPFPLPTQLPYLPGNMFSDVFMSKVNGNVNNVPTGWPAQPLGLSPTTLNPDANWARPQYWSQTQSYNPGDLVFVDTYNYTGTLANLNTDVFRFYVCIKANGPSPTSPGTANLSPNWQVWVPSSISTSPTPATPLPAMNFKANVNTATFPELFRAYWNVMNVSNGTQATTPFGTPIGFALASSFPVASAAENIYRGSHFNTVYSPVVPQYAAIPNSGAVDNTVHPERMFRSPLRDVPTRTTPRPFTSGMIFDPYQVLLLRAAIAAVNTENLRSPTSDVIARQITLNLRSDGNFQPVNVVIYGNQPQLFITEVFVQTDTTTVTLGGPPGNPAPPGPVGLGAGAPGSGAAFKSAAGLSLVNPHGYFAIELYNPSSTVSINLNNWTLAVMNRETGNKTLTSLAVTPGTPIFPAGTIIPPNQTVMLENYNPSGASDAGYRPGSSGLPMSGLAMNGALTIRDAYVQNLYLAIGEELVVLKPRAASGLLTKGADGTYSYNETTNLNDMVPVDSFDFTGLALGAANLATEWHYCRATPINPVSTWQCVYPGRYDGMQGTALVGRQQGTQTSSWNPSSATLKDPWDPTLGTPKGTPPTPPPSFGVVKPTATYSGSSFDIQLINPRWAGPNKPGPAGNSFPFGGFARNGDILEVPFVAAYRIEDMSGNMLELNSVSMDAAFAEDTDTNDDISLGTPAESIGRFTPIVPGGAGINDSTPTGPNVRYGWARRLFDFLTVQSTRDDYFPNTDPAMYPAASLAGSYPTPVANSDSSAAANTEAENTESVQGLVNINTAPLQVLQSLPLAVNTVGAVDQVNTTAIARAIVNYRQTTGPFTSLFDLNLVTNGATFQTGNGNVSFGGNGTSSTVKQGNLTPVTGIPNEFDETNLQITRLSNLITTRSDTFTVYIVIEGWQNVGSTVAALPPTLVLTRRSAFIVDRNSVTPLSRAVKTVTVPNN